MIQPCFNPSFKLEYSERLGDYFLEMTVVDSFNPSFKLEYSERWLKMNFLLNRFEVSIHLLNWNTQKDAHACFSCFIHACFNPSFKLEYSESVGFIKYIRIEEKFQSIF